MQLELCRSAMAITLIRKQQRALSLYAAIGRSGTDCRLNAISKHDSLSTSDVVRHSPDCDATTTNDQVLPDELLPVNAPGPARGALIWGHNDRPPPRPVKGGKGRGPRTPGRCRVCGVCACAWTCCCAERSACRRSRSCTASRPCALGRDAWRRSGCYGNRIFGRSAWPPSWTSAWWCAPAGSRPATWRRRPGRSGDGTAAIFPTTTSISATKKRTDISAIKKTQKNFFCDEKIKKSTDLPTLGARTQQTTAWWFAKNVFLFEALQIGRAVGSYSQGSCAILNINFHFSRPFPDFFGTFSWLYFSEWPTQVKYRH